MNNKPRLLFISASSYLYGAERCLVEVLKGICREKADIPIKE